MNNAYKDLESAIIRYVYFDLTVRTSIIDRLNGDSKNVATEILDDMDVVYLNEISELGDAFNLASLKQKLSSE